MASIKLMETKSGQRFWKISVSRGYGQSPYTTRFYWKDGWSEKYAVNQLDKAVSKFEAECASGAVLSRKELKAKEEADRIAAEQAAEEARIAAEQARLEALKIKTVRQYATDVFMKVKSITLSENARSNYQMFLDRHILPVIGDLPLTDVTPAILTKLLVDFQMTGKAHGSCIKCYNILNGMFDMAFMDDSIPVSPMGKVKRPVPRNDEKIVDEASMALTVSELSYVLSCLEKAPLKWRTYITLAADTGARRGELCGLQWSDIDMKESTITIRRNLQYTASAGVYETGPKTGVVRLVDIGPDSLALLKALHKEQADSCISKWVFTQEGLPDPMHPQRPTAYFKKFGKRYNIPGFHPHLLRHTCASIALTSGADIPSVAKRLGHSEEVLLKKYAHANPDSIKRAGQTVRDALAAEAKNAQKKAAAEAESETVTELTETA